MSKPPKDWYAILSPEAKAEILGGVLHWFEHESAIMAIVPEQQRKRISKALRDCSIWHGELSEDDLRDMKEWFKENEP